MDSRYSRNPTASIICFALIFPQDLLDTRLETGVYSVQVKKGQKWSE